MNLIKGGTMYRLVLVLLLCTSCTTNITRAQTKAILFLEQRGYETETLNHEPSIITVDDRKYIFDRESGHYNGYTKDILLLVHCPDYVAKHELTHWYLDQLGIPIYLQHLIINGR